MDKFSIGVIVATLAVPYSYIIARTMSSAYFKSKLVYNSELSKYFTEDRKDLRT